MSSDRFDPWQSMNVETWAPDEAQEPLGSKEKFWVRDDHGDRWLFKFARTGGDDSFVSGEDWAEVAAAGLGALIGIPTAVVRLGHYQERRGVLSRSIVPEGLTLVHGNELLSRTNPRYVGGQPRENTGYSVGAVHKELFRMAPPLEWRGPAAMDGFDVWAGYLVFDAWIAGSDRHDENWAAIADGSILRLASSFDHGNALGFQERPRTHRRMIEHPEELEIWARRGRCRYFVDRPELVALARSALLLASAGARRFWIAQLESVAEASVKSLLVQAPEPLLSVASRMFCERLLMVNRRRLLDDT